MSERLAPDDRGGTTKNTIERSDVSDFRLDYKSPEEQLLNLIKGWKPSGFGEVTIRLEYKDGRLIDVIKLTSEERHRLD